MDFIQKELPAGKDCFSRQYWNWTLIFHNRILVSCASCSFLNILDFSNFLDSFHLNHELNWTIIHKVQTRQKEFLFSRKLIEYEPWRLILELQFSRTNQNKVEDQNKAGQGKQRVPLGWYTHHSRRSFVSLKAVSFQFDFSDKIFSTTANHCNFHLKQKAFMAPMLQDATH